MYQVFLLKELCHAMNKGTRLFLNFPQGNNCLKAQFKGAAAAFPYTHPWGKRTSWFIGCRKEAPRSRATGTHLVRNVLPDLSPLTAGDLALVLSGHCLVQLNIEISKALENVSVRYRGQERWWHMDSTIQKANSFLLRNTLLFFIP